MSRDYLHAFYHLKWMNYMHFSQFKVSQTNFVTAKNIELIT